MWNIEDALENAIEKISSAREKLESLVTRGSAIATNVANSAITNLINETDGPLVGENRVLAESIFGEGLDYDAVTLNDSSFMAEVNENWNNGSRPFVLGNTINSAGTLTQSELIHELMHVWQYQTNGLSYIPNSISDNTYSYNADSLSTFASLPEGERLGNYNVEQQAEIVSHYFELTTIERPITAPIELHNMKDASGNNIVIDESNIDQYVADMEPFVEEVQNADPQEGLARELNEAPVEIIEEGGEAIEEVVGEVHEAGNEIRSELADHDYGAAAYEVLEGATETIYESVEGVAETGYEVAEGLVEIGLEGGKDIVGAGIDTGQDLAGDAIDLAGDTKDAVEDGVGWLGGKLGF